MSVDPGFIGDTELSNGSNFSVKDGKVRLNQRYIMWLQQQSGNRTPRGCGWGKYATGSQSEQYCAVLDDAMYMVDLTTTPAFTAVTGATSLATSDWWFQQFGEYMYAGNVTDGLGRKKLSPGTDTTGDWHFVRLPTAPTTAPGADTDFNFSIQADFSGSTISNLGFSSTTEVGGSIECVGGAPGHKSVTVTLDTSPDNRIDASYRDSFAFPLFISPLSMEIANITVTILEGANEYQAIPWIGGTGGTGNKSFRLHNVARANRDQITAIRFEFDIISGTGNVTIGAPVFYGVWLPLDSSTNPGTSYPTLKELVYEYTYFNSSTGFESPPSPSKTVPVADMGLNGEWRALTAPTTAESGVDKVRFYRVVEESGVTTRYLIAQVDNTGHPTTLTTTDKYPLDFIKTQAVFTPSILPSSGVTGLCAWQNRMVQAIGRLVHISRDGQPLVYEPQGAAFDLFNPARGLTFYPDDKRGEEIIAVIGQDDLYMVSRYSVRCLVGNSPDNWRLIKLPDSEGACGPRAVVPYKKGILVLTTSGKLMYHHSSLLEPDEVSIKVRRRHGSAGIAALATADAVLTVWPDGDIMVSNSTGNYFMMDTDGVWTKGVWTTGIHSSLPIPGLAKRWLGSTGKIAETGVDTYVSDGGTTGANGTAVTWFVDTKRHMIPRLSMRNVFWGDSVDSPASNPTYPALTPTIDGVAKTALVKREDLRNKHAPITYVGNSMLFRISGDKDTVVDRCEIRGTAMSEAEHK